MLPCEWDFSGFSRLMTSLFSPRRQTARSGFDTRFDRWKDDLMEETDTKRNKHQLLPATYFLLGFSYTRRINETI